MHIFSRDRKANVVLEITDPSKMNALGVDSANEAVEQTSAKIYKKKDSPNSTPLPASGTSARRGR